MASPGDVAGGGERFGPQRPTPHGAPRDAALPHDLLGLVETLRDRGRLGARFQHRLEEQPPEGEDDHLLASAGFFDGGPHGGQTAVEIATEAGDPPEARVDEEAGVVEAFDQDRSGGLHQPCRLGQIPFQGMQISEEQLRATHRQGVPELPGGGQGIVEVTPRRRPVSSGDPVEAQSPEHVDQGVAVAGHQALAQETDGFVADGAAVRVAGEELDPGENGERFAPQSGLGVAHHLDRLGGVFHESFEVVDVAGAFSGCPQHHGALRRRPAGHGQHLLHPLVALADVVHRPEERQRGGEAEGEVGFALTVGPVEGGAHVVQFGLEAEPGRDHLFAEHGVADSFHQVEVEPGVAAADRLRLAGFDELAVHVLPDGFQQPVAVLAAFGRPDHE